MKKNILYYAGVSGRTELMHAISEQMPKKNYEASFLANHDSGLEFLEGKVAKKRLFVVRSKQGEGPAVDDKELLRIEKKYGFRTWDVWSITGARPQNHEIPKELIKKYVFNAVKAYERIFEKHDFDALVMHGLAGYHTVLAQIVAAAKGVRVLQLVDSRVSGRFGIFSNGEWDYGVGKTYTKYRKQGAPKKALEEAQGYIEEFVNKPKSPKATFHYKESKIDFAKRATKAIQSAVRGEYLWKIIGSETRRRIGGVRQGIKESWHDRKSFERPVKGEKYVLYPLHFQPEASTLVYGKYFVNQQALIENIAKNLPADTMVYVKEHRHGYGKRPLNYYEYFKEFPNIKVLSPQEKIFELIKNAEAVITVTGTAGWEALLLGVPAMTFGDVFYNEYEQTKHTKSFEDFSTQLDELLATKIDKDEVLTFVATLYAVTYEGMARAPGDCKGKSLEQGNIKKLAVGIREALKEA